MSDSNDNKDRLPKESGDSPTSFRIRSILALGSYSARIIPIAIGVALGFWGASVLTERLGNGVIAFTVGIVCLALFSCWVFKKGYDLGRK